MYHFRYIRFFIIQIQNQIFGGEEYEELYRT